MENGNCVTVELLGGLKATRPDHVQIEFPTRKAATLFAYLAFHLGRDAIREDIAGMLWPEADPAGARNSLSVALSAIRKQLGPEHQADSVLVTDNRAIKLNP